MLDLPTISNASYASSTIEGGGIGTGIALQSATAAVPRDWAGDKIISADDWCKTFINEDEMVNRNEFLRDAVKWGKARQVHLDNQESNMAQAKRRLVQVIIVDPNENIPLDNCVVYQGGQKLTDLNDQELFFELDIKALLERHNAIRTKVRDKKVKEREEFLEPAKIRDLKMVVVNIAEF